MALAVRPGWTMSITTEGENTAGIAPSSDVKTKQQKKDEGRRRAVEIALSRRGAAPGDEAAAGNANAKRGHRKSARHGARNQDRHKHFAKWLLARFPHVVAECGDVGADARSPCAATASDDGDAATRPQHILDVAGGKGELSARLSLCHSLRVTMIDPRRADIPSVYLHDVVPKLPQKWQASVRARVRHSPSFVHDELEHRFSQLVEPFTAPSCPIASPANELGEHQFYRHDHVDAAVRDAALLVGLHADGATEAIVDAALLYHKPFVVVPCCVFPNLFRARYVIMPSEDAVEAEGDVGEDSGDKAPEGRRVPVRSHAQFCQYLLDKDPRFVMEVLPFEGRNVAIWWDGR